MTPASPAYPLLLNPTLYVKVWGGRKLAQVMQKNLPTEEPYGESWEIHGSAVVANGPFAGRTLGDLMAHYSHTLIGQNSDSTQELPLLAKFLDAAEWLSIQVHPNDAQAARLENQPRGKTEAWYILAADPGAQLVIGVRPGTARQEMAEAIQQNRLEELLVYASVTAGDVLYLPGGTIHAVGPGILIYEIQQTSDTTYRLYDWGRIGLDGQPRPLHIEKGIEVSNVAFLPTITHPESTSCVTVLVESDFFITTLHRTGVSAPQTLDTHHTHFHALTCAEGAATIASESGSITLQTGRSALIPAVVGAYTLSGDARVICSRPTG